MRNYPLQNTYRGYRPAGELRAEVEEWWRDLEEEERRRRGGYYAPLATQWSPGIAAWQSGGGLSPPGVPPSMIRQVPGALPTTGWGMAAQPSTTVLLRQWIPYGAGGVAGGAGGAGTSGLNDAALKELADLIYSRSMAQVSSDFGRRGMMSSSMYGAASARAAAEAQLLAYEMRQAQLQSQLQLRQLELQAQQLRQQAEAERHRYELQRQSLMESQYWRQMAQRMSAIPELPDISEVLEPSLPYRGKYPSWAGWPEWKIGYRPTASAVSQRRPPTPWEREMGLTPAGASGFLGA